MFKDVRTYYNAAAGEYYEFNPKRWFKFDNIYNKVDYKELITKIANQMANNLVTDKRYDNDKPYIFTGRKSFTRQEMAEEITNQTEVGLQMIENIIMLALDLVLRDKERIDNVTIKQD